MYVIRKQVSVVVVHVWLDYNVTNLYNFITSQHCTNSNMRLRMDTLLITLLSDIQREIIQEVYIEEPSTYRMIVNYHNPTTKTIVGRIRITPEDPASTEQEDEVHLTPTTSPRLMTVEAVLGNFPQPLVLDPGRWPVSFEKNQNFFLDYFVLLPLTYYEGSILTRNTSIPCLAEGNSDLCLHYAYPNVFQYDYIYGSAGYRSFGEE
ncbi:hypothetical protein Pmani_003661 [Petrolisthes manimaculis]|uniref:Uncharacterized protein n=1 Tax=Petrolisthes manimaculis TaxID=1843537 RepID=A0AAE1QG12_9EUCA|nr:hypothetical protein Pmani_003661 [Petrolisthes manimaculis]